MPAIPLGMARAAIAGGATPPALWQRIWQRAAAMLDRLVPPRRPGEMPLMPEWFKYPPF